MRYLIFLLLCGTAYAQHAVVGTWTAPSDADATSTYNVYRANAKCANPTPPMTFLVNVDVTTFEDDTVTPGD